MTLHLALWRERWSTVYSLRKSGQSDWLSASGTGAQMSWCNVQSSQALHSTQNQVKMVPKMSENAQQSRKCKTHLLRPKYHIWAWQMGWKCRARLCRDMQSVRMEEKMPSGMMYSICLFKMWLGEWKCNDSCRMGGAAGFWAKPFFLSMVPCSRTLWVWTWNIWGTSCSWSWDISSSRELAATSKFF